MEIVSYKIAKKLKGKRLPYNIGQPNFLMEQGRYGWEDLLLKSLHKAGELISNYYDLPTDGQDVAAPTISKVLEWFRSYKKMHLILVCYIMAIIQGFIKIWNGSGWKKMSTKNCFLRQMIYIYMVK